MDTILYPSYFSPIIHYVVLAQHTSVLFEVEDHFQKQTYRNRCYIYGANGKQMLNIPVKHSNASRKTKDVRVEYSFGWQKQHLRTMQTAYRASPYFEFYEDELANLLEQRPQFLLDLNLIYQEFVSELLQLELQVHTSNEYHKTYENVRDLRPLVNAKVDKKFGLENYTQVFSDRHGFIENLSILDLIFMEGPNALNYLLRQEIVLK